MAAQALFPTSTRLAPAASLPSQAGLKQVATGVFQAPTFPQRCFDSGRSSLPLGTLRLGLPLPAHHLVQRLGKHGLRPRGPAALVDPWGNGGGGDRGWVGGGGSGGGDDEPGDSWRQPLLLLASLAAAFGAALLFPPKEAEAESSDIPNGVSVIVPVLNESKTITQTLRYLKLLEPQPLEVIVVDGGSTDGTPNLVKKQGAKLIRGSRGRAKQMNLGASAAKGQILCFLHADTLPPLNLVSQVRTTLAKPQVVLGGFFPIIQVPERVLWFSSLHNASSTWYAPMLFRPLSFLRGLRLLFGDQVQFCRQKDFKAVGGFNPELIIMEDADLCIRMHMEARGDGRRGRVKMLPSLVQTSGRRINSWGPLRSTWIQFRIALQWYLGGSPEDLRQTYQRIYTDSHR